MTNTTTNTTKNNGWEKIAKRNLLWAYNNIVGGNENAVSDGDMTKEAFQNWIATTALEDVYHEGITTYYDAGFEGGPAPAEMRFAGKDFCYKYLISLFKKDGYTVTAPEAQATTKATKTTKKSTTTKATKKTTIIGVLKAFTGMEIATYTVEMTKNGYRITLKNGKTMEFNTDGTQKGKQSRFNNRLTITEIVEA